MRVLRALCFQEINALAWMILAAPAAMALVVLFIIRLFSKVGGYILCFFFLLMGVAPFVYDFYASILKTEQLAGDWVGFGVLLVVGLSVVVGCLVFWCIAFSIRHFQRNIKDLVVARASPLKAICRDGWRYIFTKLNFSSHQPPATSHQPPATAPVAL